MGDSGELPSALSQVSLTARETEILELKARRRTNAEIAEQLFISLTTVKWHVRQIYNKLGANRRADAVAVARQLGLLAPNQKRVGPPPTNLPRPPTPFVGRTQETEYLIALLGDPDMRLVTVTGPGGIGKTRLAIQVANSLRDYFGDGVFWVAFPGRDEKEFVFTTAADYILSTLAAVLGLSLHGEEDPQYTLQAYLRQKEILLVFDAFEHLLSGALGLSELLTSAPRCKFLVTSRERLNLPGEILYTITGLALSEEAGGDITAADAATLFLQTAGRISNRGYTEPSDLAAVDRICGRLEGVPLAIELAADWTRLLTPGEIEGELDRGLAFLDHGSTGIRSVIERSWNGLTEGQRASFARLAVFQRGFSREAAQQVADTGLQRLTALFDKSLIQRTADESYAMHDILRQFAAEQLAARGDLEAVRDRHCAHFAGLAAGQMASLFRGDHGVMLANLDDLRAAWRWGIRRRRLDDLHKMLYPLDWFLEMRAYYAEGEALMRLAVEALQTPHPEGMQSIVLGWAMVGQGLKQARLYGAHQGSPIVLQGIEILREHGTRSERAWPLILAAFHSGIPRSPQQREQFCLESLEIFEEMGDPYGVAFALVILSNHYRELGRYNEARRRIGQGLAASRALGDREGTAHALRSLGHLDLNQGQYDTARDNFQEEYDLWRSLSLSRLAGEALRFRGEAAMAAGNYETAEMTLLQALAEFEEMGDRGNALASLLDLAQLAWQRGQDKKAFDLLQEAPPILQHWRENYEHARWWRLSGRLQLEQGDLEAARTSLSQALAYSIQAGDGAVVETILDFAYLARDQIDEETAVRLLGFVQGQASLPAWLIQGRLEPLHASLAAKMDRQSFESYLEEGATRDRQALVDMLEAAKS